MQENSYLSTEQAAAYLHIKERKLYDLVANGMVPCSKVTGKWLFPRTALDRWIATGLTEPAGFCALAPPPIIGGSHDLLLEWAVRRSNARLALLSEGSEAGLAHLARNDVMLAALHRHDTGGGDRANEVAVLADQGFHDVVLIAFARREQGLVLAAGNPLSIDGLEAAIRARARIGLRQKGAGAQLLLEALAARQGLTIGSPVSTGRGQDGLETTATTYPTGHDLALGIRAGEIDCGIATRSIALSHGLAFMPLVWENFDLAMRRRSYFEPGPQALLALMRKPEFGRQAALLGGYDVSEAGSVRLNR